MKKFKYIFLFMLLTQIVFSQEKISDNGRFLAVSPNEDYVIYFKTLTDEPDEYIEGNIYIYDVAKKESLKLNTDTYVYDFIDVEWAKKGCLFISSGNKIEKYTIDFKKERSVFKVIDKQWITSFSLSEDNSCLLINIEENINDEKNQKILLLDLSTSDSKEIYKKIVDLKGGYVKVNALMSSNNDYVYIKNTENQLMEYNVLKESIQMLDKDVIELFRVGHKNIYYSKRNIVIDYGIFTKEKVEIIESDKLGISYFSTYKEKLFICLNDNIFIYDKTNKSFKNIEQLGKRNFIFFSKKMAIEYREQNNSLIIYKNT